MTKLTKDQVRHIAKLARLQLSEEEVEKFTTELTAILQYVEKLNEVNTDDVEPTAQATDLRNVLRSDAPRPDAAYETPETLLRPASRPSREELLATSPLPIVDDQIVTASAHG